MADASVAMVAFLGERLSAMNQLHAQSIVSVCTRTHTHLLTHYGDCMSCSVLSQIKKMFSQLKTVSAGASISVQDEIGHFSMLAVLVVAMGTASDTLKLLIAGSLLDYVHTYLSSADNVDNVC